MGQAKAQFQKPRINSDYHRKSGFQICMTSKGLGNRVSLKWFKNCLYLPSFRGDESLRI